MEKVIQGEQRRLLHSPLPGKFATNVQRTKGQAQPAWLLPRGQCCSEHPGLLSRASGLSWEGGQVWRLEVQAEHIPVLTGGDLEEQLQGGTASEGGMPEPK